MNPDAWASRRRLRAFARGMLLAGFALFVFSIFFYSAVFFFPGNGLALHSGRLSIITSNDTTGGMPVGLSCDRTTPVMLFKPLFVFGPQSSFIAVPQRYIRSGKPLAGQPIPPNRLERVERTLAKLPHDARRRMGRRRATKRPGVT